MNLNSVSLSSLHFSTIDWRACVGLGNVDASIKAIYFSSKFYENTNELPQDTRFGIVLDKTNFYAESGGQENDTGRIVIDGKTDFLVDDVQVYNGYVLHVGTLQEGSFALNDQVVSTYDEVSPSLSLSRGRVRADNVE